MINGDGKHHTFVIERCLNDAQLRRKALKWARIHGPNTRVYVDTRLRHVHLCWEPVTPATLLPVTDYLTTAKI